MGHNILLVTDDRETKELLMLHLNSNGFTVDIAENEEMFNVCFGHQKTNLILIDMMMKSLNIYELIRVIRLNSNLPIILIADKENDANRILGLNLGADACVIKPYNPLEVIAEVQAMLRRYYELGCGGRIPGETMVLRVGELVLDTEAFVLRKNGNVLSLTSEELKILAKLMRSPKRVFTKTQLCECINGRYYENDDRTMMVHISNIRAKIEDDPANPKYIKTVRGFGYKIDSDD